MMVCYHIAKKVTTQACQKMIWLCWLHLAA